ARLRKDIRLEIRKLQQRLDQTAVFVTHDQEEALAISDKIAILKDGTLEQYGAPTEVWESPRSPYVAEFMGVDNVVPFGSAIFHSYRKRLNDIFHMSQPGSRVEVSHVGFRASDAFLADGNTALDVIRFKGVVVSSTYT